MIDPIETLDRKLNVVAQQHLLNRITTLESRVMVNLSRVDRGILWCGVLCLSVFGVLAWHEKDIRLLQRRMNDCTKSIVELRNRSDRIVYVPMAQTNTHLLDKSAKV